MKEPYMKGVTTHHGPMSCVSRCEAGCEKQLATGKHEPAIELRNHTFRVPALLIERIGNTRLSAIVRTTAARRSRMKLRECGRFLRENRESPEWCPLFLAGRSGKACGRKPDVYATGKSDIGCSTIDPAEQSLSSGGGGRRGKNR